MSDRIVELRRPRLAYEKPRQVIMEFSPSRTKQAPKEATDVNGIIARYQKTGVLPVTRAKAVYADVAAMQGFDFGDALHKITEVNEKFMALPAHIRDYMKNDPQVFVEFVSNPDNVDKAVELGLISKPVAKEEVN